MVIWELKIGVCRLRAMVPPAVVLPPPHGGVACGAVALIVSDTYLPCELTKTSFTTDQICQGKLSSRSFLNESSVLHMFPTRAWVSCARSAPYLLATKTSTKWMSSSRDRVDGFTLDDDALAVFTFYTTMFLVFW
jgi:hypothetical protein